MGDGKCVPVNGTTETEQCTSAACPSSKCMSFENITNESAYDKLERRYLDTLLYDVVRA